MLWKRRNIFPRIKIFVIWVVSLAFAVLVSHSAAHAQVAFDPSTGSYFEFVEQSTGEDGRWLDVQLKAQQRIYKGIRGRLAVIKSWETHKFIEENFEIRTGAWIGLRYFCANRKLVWVTGETLKTDSGFQPWHRRWARTNVRCADLGYMPVYYTTVSKGRLAWQASGPNKGFNTYIIEYPTQK